MCDGSRDCDDGTDETRCYEQGAGPAHGAADTCPHGFTCDRGLTCLDWAAKCDGHLDCLDGSDEEMCELWRDLVYIRGVEADPALRTHDSLAIRWWLEQAGRGRGAELQYKFSYSVHSHNSWTNASEDWAASTEQRYTFTGLHPATDYDLRVFVRNLTSAQETRHAPVVTARTGDWVPSCPRDIAATQRGDAVLVTWSRPASPNGDLTKYLVQVFRGDNMVKEMEVLVPSQEALTMNKTVYGLETGVEYRVAVVAANSAYQSGECPGSSARLVARIGEVTVTPSGPREAVLHWQHEGVTLLGTQYEVCHTAANRLEGTVCHQTTVASLHLSGLSPGTTYNASVRAGTSSPARATFTTPGPQLPRPQIIDIGFEGDGTAEGSPTRIKLTWNFTDISAAGYQFGVWRGVSLAELHSFRPTLVRATEQAGSLTLENLLGCTDYIFAVAIFDPAEHGVGPLSAPVHLATRFSPESPPRNLALDPASPGTLRWEAPCKQMPRPVRYHLHLTVTNLYNDSVTSQPSAVTLAPVSNTSLSYRLTGLVAGAVYRVRVQTDTSLASEMVEVLGPALPPPRQVYAHPGSRDQAASFLVSWARVPEADHYDVVLSPDPSFTNHTCEIVFPRVADTSIPVMASDLVSHVSAGCQPDHQFSVGVRTVVVDENGNPFMSAFSRAGKIIISMNRSLPWLCSGNTIMTVAVEEPGTITIPESSAVGTVVGVLVVLALLGAGVAYYAHTNRRMRHRFRELIASHYSSATGHATINHHGLMDDLDDDDESPIIRGFNDKEPLVT